MVDQRRGVTASLNGLVVENGKQSALRLKRKRLKRRKCIGTRMAHLTVEQQKVEDKAVAKHLKTHNAGEHSTVNVVLVGQLAFFCQHCGNCTTIDTIRAEAKAGTEDHH